MDEIIKDMGEGRTPPEIQDYFERPTDDPEIEGREPTTEILSYFLGQIDSICTLRLIGKSAGEEKSMIRFALNKKRGAAERIDRDYQRSAHLKKSDPDSNPATSYLEKRLQEFQ